MTATRADGDAGGSACDGVEGQDIGVFEQNNSASESLQRTGTGLTGSDFTWVGPATASAGSINANQNFGDPVPTPAPTPAPETFLFGKTVMVGSVPVGFYDRDADYPTWDDTDGDGISNRHEVLIAQHVDDDPNNPLVMSSSGQAVRSGKWYDPFDDVVYFDADNVQIDHVVALYESHISGAGVWTTATEKRTYANTGNKVEGTLPETSHQFLAVGANSNSAKGSSDPTEWMPSNSDYHCTYLKKWVEIKHINDLYFDQAEYDFIKAEETNCDNSALPLLPANDNDGGGGGGGGGNAPQGSVFINELHYDMIGVDEGEFVEVAGPAGTDLSGWKLEFYNGNNDSLYDQISLSGILSDAGEGYGFTVAESSQIQNGDADGIGLIDADNNCVELISYEGTMSPASGPCAEFLANDIGVSQSNNTNIDESLQKTGTGTISSDFEWIGPVEQTKGAANDNQSFGSETRSFIVTNQGNDYLIDDVLHATITVKRGQTVVFDTNSFGNAHPFRISTTPDGTFGGGVSYEEGVTRNPNEFTWVVPTDLENDVMYYYCTIHRGMAGPGAIYIID